MPFLQRLAIFLGLWLLAGITCATFAQLSLEAGESEAMARLQLVFFTPLMAVIGIATLIAGDHNHKDLNAIACVVMACFVAHSIAMLTRRDRLDFKVMVAVQVLILGASAASVLRFLHISMDP